MRDSPDHRELASFGEAAHHLDKFQQKRLAVNKEAVAGSRYECRPIMLGWVWLAEVQRLPLDRHNRQQVRRITRQRTTAMFGVVGTFPSSNRLTIPNAPPKDCNC